jgi:hypothetical protein
MIRIILHVLFTLHRAAFLVAGVITFVSVSYDCIRERWQAWKEDQFWKRRANGARMVEEVPV